MVAIKLQNPMPPNTKALLLIADAFQLQQICLVLLPQRSGGAQPCDQPVPLCGLHPGERPVAVVG